MDTLTGNKNDQLNKILDRLKQDPLFELRQEFGQFLLRHIDSLSIEERKRYDELKSILISTTQSHPPQPGK